MSNTSFKFKFFISIGLEIINFYKCNSDAMNVLQILE